MNVKKKLISSLKKCFILSLCVVIGLAASLQGFCASPTKNYIEYKDITLAAQLFNSNGSKLNDGNEIALSNVDVWKNYFFPIPASSGISGSYIIKIYIKDFFNNLSSENTYHYHLTFGFTGGSTVYNLFGSTATVYVNRQGFSVSKSSVSNGDTRFICDFSFSGISGTSNLTLEVPITIKSAVSFSFLCSSYGESSYYTVVTGTDKVIGAIGSDTPNTSQIDEYNKAESQLIGGVQSSLDGITSQWDNINGDLSQYGGAFFALRQFFNGLTDLPFISVVITLSVAIGVFALLLGSALEYVKGTQMRNERERSRAETRAYREKMLQKRGKGK